LPLKELRMPTRASNTLTLASMSIVLLVGLLPTTAAAAGLADEVVGRWKLLSHVSTFQGQTMDTRAALLTQRPCAADIVYELKPDKSFRLDVSGSSCDDAYKSIQQKLYAKQQWKLDGNRMMISATNFAVGQTYTVSVSGKRMTWVGTEGQGTLTYQRQ
jgi:hypothetical protein